MSKKERGRPMCSHQVHVIPEYREIPDMEKLGKALIAIAASIAEKKKAENGVFRRQYNRQQGCASGSANRREGGMT